MERRYRTVKSLLFTLLVAFGLFLPSTAFALSLDEAKARGLVGERSNGYLGAVEQSPSPEVQALLTEINSKRRTQYEGIAKKNGTSRVAVEKLAAEKAINLTPAGQYIEIGNGWQKKQ